MIDKINVLKKHILIAVNKCQEGHIPSAFSIIDILYVLYHKILNVDPENFSSETRDRFILSKGHASLGLYSVLSSKNFFSMDELKTFGSFDSFLGGHPDCNKVPGVEASTGSLGHGFPTSIGIALALKIKKSNSRVFVLIGDGECNEGTIWEGALLASNYKLNNLTCIIDYNHSNDRSLKLDSLRDKFSSFGWETMELDGHNHSEIEETLSYSNNHKPLAIIAHTIKGKGIAEMENNPAWHHKSPSDQELEIFIKELNK